MNELKIDDLSNNKAKIKTFEELLLLGRTQLQNYKNKITDSNLTGIESQLYDYIDDMIELNNYGYTNVSTNFYEYALFVGFTVEKKTALKLAPLLREKKYWFSVTDGKDLLDIEVNDALVSQKKLVWEEPQEGHIISSSYENFLLGKGWYTVGNLNYRYHSIYNIGTVENNIKKVQTGYYFPECRDYTVSKLFEGDNPLVDVFVENPIVERKTLYRDLVNIFKNL